MKGIPGSSPAGGFFQICGILAAEDPADSSFEIPCEHDANVDFTGRFRTR
jgi:hypothetical protein